MEVQHLADLLQGYADQFGDPAGLTADLNALSIEHRDNSRKVMGDVKAVIGAAATRRLLESMEAAGAADSLIRNALSQLNGHGLDFTDVDVQQAIDDMAANVALPMTDADAIAVKAIGIRHESPFQAAGGLGDVTQAEVEAGIVCLTLQQWTSGKCQDALSAIRSGTLTTQAAVQAVFAPEEGGSL